MKNKSSQKNEQVRPLFGRFIRSNLPVLLVILGALVLGGFMEVYPAKYMQQIVNGLITNAVSFSMILGLVGLWYGCRVVGAIANFYSGYFTGKISSSCGGYFRKIIFDRIINSYCWDRNNASTADVTTRVINDASELGDVIIRPLYVVGKNLFIFSWSVLFLVQIDWILLLACIPLGVIMLVLGGAIAEKSRIVVRKIKIHETKLAKVILESMTAAKEMIIYRFGNHQSREFNEYSETVIEAQIKGSRLLTALDSNMDCLWPLATVACLALGSYRVLNGDLSIGGLVAFMWYIQWVIHPISQISNYKSQIQTSIVSLERIDELLGWYPGDCENSYEGSLKKYIKLENVSYQYKTGDNQGINNIDLEVEVGQTIAIVGKTGCGKSTLLKVILGLIQTASGNIFIDGNPVHAKLLHGARFSAAAFSDPFIFDTTLKNNIVMGSGEENTPLTSMELLEKVIKMAGVDEFLHQLPKGVDTIIGNTGQGLSSGQMQRIVLARALFKQPQLLILDEATDSIDSETERKIFDAIGRDKNNYACIIVSHRLSSVMDADIIYYMGDGEICSTGTHSSLLATCSGYKSLYYSQLADKKRI